MMFRIVTAAAVLALTGGTPIEIAACEPVDYEYLQLILPSLFIENNFEAFFNEVAEVDEIELCEPTIIKLRCVHSGIVGVIFANNEDLALNVKTAMSRNAIEAVNTRCDAYLAAEESKNKHQ